MTVRILLAPAGGGKTAHVIARIRALPPLSPVCVLVPDQIKAAAFRRRLARAGGAMGVEVQTFYGLYADVLAVSGSSADVPPSDSPPMARLTPALRYRLIRHLVARLCDDGALVYYAPLRTAPGFGRLLTGLFEELKRARVFPEALLSATADCEPRLAELARLYDAYQAWLINHHWVDAEGQGWLAAIALEQNPALLSDLALLVADGFDEFNPTQLDVLRLLADRADETVVTLLGDPHRPHRLAHRRFARARAALAQALGVEPIPCPPPDAPSVSLPPASLVHLEAHLFEPNAVPLYADNAITFIEAQNRAAEAREALRWLKSQVVRDGAPLSDVAVVARDVTPYRLFLEEAAAEFGMPLRFAAGAPLHANPAIAALLNVLTLPLPAVDWSPRALLDALTSPYFDWTADDAPLDAVSADRLGDVARAGQVVTGLEQWREAFGRLVAGDPGARDEASDLAEDDEGLARRHPPAGAEAARLSDAFEELVARITPPSTATLRQRVAWLEELIGEEPTSASGGAPPWGIVACARQNAATRDRDVAALQALKDILRSMVLAESVVGESGQDVSHEAFVAELLQSIEETSYRHPVAGDAILVASAADVRDLSFDSAALLGLGEGDFPRAERADVLLREADRAWLAAHGFPIEPRLLGDEASFFYQAITRARRRLLLCRPYLADDGQPWEPSPYWEAVRRLLADTPKRTRHVRSTDPIADVASAQELTASAPGEATAAARAVLVARDQPTPSPWRGDLSALTARLDERFGPECPWSSSRLETYAKCPFYFWAAYGMELEPRELPQIGFDVLILGSIYHLVLERLYTRVSDADPDRLRAALPQVAQQVYDAAPHDYGFRPTPLWERQQEELTEVLLRTLEGLIEIAGEYRPAAPELAFGLHGRAPLELHGEHPLKLRGYIDRVDRAPDGRIRIIDYKAGSTRIPARDLTRGYRLQLPLYALAAEQALGAEVASGFYWHISSAQPSGLVLEKYEGGVPGAIETAVAHATEIVAAVRAGQFAPAPPDDGCPTFCPAAAFCEGYKPRSW
ncbi:MAG TPA: hypothetical protein ENN99_04250 [Chloroflexi bacterium]|nr:hypothetical protein [Chloroflexota bacterium]